jgi:hypothetical protein
VALQELVQGQKRRLIFSTDHVRIGDEEDVAFRQTPAVSGAIEALAPGLVNELLKL